MSAERPVLIREQIARAERREGVSHPVLSVIEQHLPTITHLAQGYSQIKDGLERQRYIKEHYGFLADALIEVGPYTMEPTDIIAIWSRATEVFSMYHRYALAGVVSSAYAVYGMDNPVWTNFPRHYLETEQLPAGVASDREGLLHVKGRLDEIRENLGDLNLYMYGNRSPVETARRLCLRIQDGDAEAEAEINRLIAFEKEHETPVLVEIRENFGNGYGLLRFSIRDALNSLGDGPRKD